MPINLGSAFGRVDIDVSSAKRSAGDFDQSMRQMETGLNRVGARAQGAMNAIGTKLQSALDGTIGQLKSLPGDIVAGFTGGIVAGLTTELIAMPQRVGEAVVQAAQKTTQFAMSMDRLAQSTGLSLQQVSALSYATDRYKISQETLNSSMSAFARYLVATKGSSANIQQEFMNAADQLQRMPPGIDRSTMAMKMFGEAGARLLPILAQGSAGMQQFGEAATRAGKMIDENVLAAAKRFEDAQQRMEDAQNRFNVVIGNAALPLLAQLYENSNRATDGGDRLGAAWQAFNQVLGEFASKGAITEDAFRRFDGSISLVLASVFSLSPALSGLANQFDAAGNAAISAGSKAAAGASMMAGAAQTMVVSVDMFNARMADLARSQAMISYTQMRYNEQQNAGFIIARQTQGVLDSSYQAQARAYYQKQQALLQGEHDIEQKRAMIQSERSNNAVIDEANKKLDDQIAALTAHGGASRGAAAGIDALAAAQEELAQRTQQMQGLMGQSLEPMNRMQKLQSAYALATGQTTLAQEQMKIAVQGVMKGFDAGSISMADALGLVLALRNGQIDYTRALQAAGPAAQPYINDLNEFTAAATEGTAKVLQMSQGVDNLPGKAEVKIDATVTGLPQVDDLHDRVKGLPTEKTVTIRAVVIGLDQLAGDFYNFAPRTGSQPVIPSPGNLDTPLDGQDPGQGAGQGQNQTQTLNVNVDGQAVAQATVRNGTQPTTKNQRRNYRRP